VPWRRIFSKALKGLCHQFRSSWKWCNSRATNIDMWRLILKFCFTCSLIFYSYLYEVLKLRLQNHSNYHFYFEYAYRMLYAHSKYSESSSAWILLVNTRRGKSYWLSASLAHFLLALAISLRRQVLLYAHSTCLGNCSMRIQNMARAALFYHVGA
jgi:hypothetical protein